MHLLRSNFYATVQLFETQRDQSDVIRCDATRWDRFGRAVLCRAVLAGMALG